jgi:hypothetical protein
MYRLFTNIVICLKQLNIFNVHINIVIVIVCYVKIAMVYIHAALTIYVQYCVLQTIHISILVHLGNTTWRLDLYWYYTFYTETIPTFGIMHSYSSDTPIETQTDIPKLMFPSLHQAGNNTIYYLHCDSDI